MIARTPAPLLTPQTESELTGIVNRVTFPAGALVIDGVVHLYYGSGDQGICLATCELDALLAHLKSFPTQGQVPAWADVATAGCSRAARAPEHPRRSRREPRR